MVERGALVEKSELGETGGNDVGRFELEILTSDLHDAGLSRWLGRDQGFGVGYEIAARGGERTTATDPTISPTTVVADILFLR